MRQVKLLMLAILAMVAFSAVGTAVAHAEETEEKNNPRLLVLTGKASEVVGKFKGEGSTLEALPGGKGLQGTGVTAEISKCENIAEHTLDFNLCKDIPITFTGVTTNEKKINCTSENLKKEKAKNIGEVLVLLDLHLAAEKSTEGVLQPLLIALVLSIELDPTLLINCAGVKQEVKGKIACLLLPGLTQIPAGGNVEILCKQKEGDQITGTCEVEKSFCEGLAKEPFEASLGEGFKDAAEAIHLLGSFNVSTYIDD
jgi:hypothetical protein